MIAAVAVDDWKVKLFEGRLKEAGFEIVSKTVLLEGSTIFKVKFDDFNKLHEVVKTCQEECALLRRVN